MPQTFIKKPVAKKPGLGALPPTPAPPIPTPAADLAQLLAVVLAYRPQPWAWPRPRPAYLPTPSRRLPRLRGVVRCSSFAGKYRPGA